MTAPNHLQIYNPDRTLTDHGLSFHRFPDLSAELRLQIWRYALRRNRIITVVLVETHQEMLRLLRPDEARCNRPALGAASHDVSDNTTESTSIHHEVDRDDRWSNSGHTSLCDICVQGYHIIPNFYRVCREARETAMSFYRVRIPSFLT